MAVRLNFGVSPPDEETAARLSLFPQAPLGAPSGGTLAPGQGTPGPGDPPQGGASPLAGSGGNAYLAMAKKMLLQQLQQETAPAESEKKKGFDWMHLIPGYAQGKAEKEKRQQQKDLLKLQQRQMAGADASQQLQRLQMLGKLEQEEQQRQVGQQISTLFGQGQALTDPAMQQQVLAGIARTGNLELLTKMQTYFQGQQDLSLLNAPPAARAPAETAAPTAPAVSPTAPPASAPPSMGTGTGPVSGAGTPAFQAKAAQVAQRLGMQPADLMAIMQFETGGTLSPAVRNAAGSGATGLIQFLPSTAAGLGTSPQALAQMTGEQQLDVVERYLTPYKGKLGTLQDAYMAVLSPQTMGAPPETVLFRQGTKAYEQNAGLDPQRKGVITVGDAVGQVRAFAQRAGAGTAAAAPAATDGDLLRLRGLEAQRDQMTSTMQDLQQIQRRIRTPELRQEVDKRIDNARQQLQFVETQIQHTETRAREQRRDEAAVFDKDFTTYFAMHHAGQKPSEALAHPKGAAVVQQAKTAFDAAEAQRKAHEDFVKESLTQPLKLARADASKALTPISDTMVKSLANNKSIYDSISKIEGFFREGTDLPQDFVNLVAQDHPGIQQMLKDDPKNVTGILKQFETKWKAAASNDPRVNRFLSAVGNMRDLIVKERSGTAVSAPEMTRVLGAFVGSLANLNQAFPLFVNNVANVKQATMDLLVTMGSTVRPLSGGDVVFEGLPAEVKAQIVLHEQQAAARKHAREQQAPVLLPAGTPTIVAP